MMPKPEYIEWMKKAVESGTPLVITYGTANAERRICPHMLGLSKTGMPVLHAFQYGGYSGKGNILNPMDGEWRFFYLENIISASMLPASCWYPATLNKSEEKYTPPKFITEILAIHKEQ
jgi:hypothetical protein